MTTMTVDQRVRLAQTLGLPPTATHEQFVARIEEMQRRAARSFADADPTGILKLDRTATATAPRTPTTADGPGEALLDAAVGRGAIAMEERSAWRRRFAEEPDLVREILAKLPGDPARADRAFEEDGRIRSLGDAFDDYMGVAEGDQVRDDGMPLDPTGLPR